MLLSRYVQDVDDVSVDVYDKKTSNCVRGVTTMMDDDVVVGNLTLRVLPGTCEQVATSRHCRQITLIQNANVKLTVTILTKSKA